MLTTVSKDMRGIRAKLFMPMVQTPSRNWAMRLEPGQRCRGHHVASGQGASANKMKLSSTTTAYTPSMPNELQRYSRDCILPLGVRRMMCCAQRGPSAHVHVPRQTQGSSATYGLFDQEQVYQLPQAAVKRGVATGAPSQLPSATHNLPRVASATAAAKGTGHGGHDTLVVT